MLTYIVGGWVKKSPKTCLRSIWMFPQKFEYVEDMVAQGDTPYYCDCCDPARQKKRQYSESDSEDAEDENEDGEYINPKIIGFDIL